jgi:hypothetical protein
LTTLSLVDTFTDCVRRVLHWAAHVLADIYNRSRVYVGSDSNNETEKESSEPFRGVSCGRHVKSKSGMSRLPSHLERVVEGEGSDSCCGNAAEVSASGWEVLRSRFKFLLSLRSLLRFSLLRGGNRCVHLLFRRTRYRGIN